MGKKMPDKPFQSPKPTPAPSALRRLRQWDQSQVEKISAGFSLLEAAALGLWDLLGAMLQPKLLSHQRMSPQAALVTS